MCQLLANVIVARLRAYRFESIRVRTDLIDLKPTDSITIERESVIQIHSSTWEVPRQMDAGEEPIAVQALHATDVSRILVDRRGLVAPLANPNSSIPCLPLVDHDCVISKESAERIEVPGGLRIEVARDRFWNWVRVVTPPSGRGQEATPS